MQSNNNKAEQNKAAKLSETGNRLLAIENHFNLTVNIHLLVLVFTNTHTHIYTHAGCDFKTLNAQLFAMQITNFSSAGQGFISKCNASLSPILFFHRQIIHSFIHTNLHGNHRFIVRESESSNYTHTSVPLNSAALAQ